jgi:hypothetical protein
MIQYFIPRIARADVRPMFAVAAIGGIVAGLYGVLHDQATYTISPEYFTKLKFQQFAYADFGLGDRVFVGTIGFLATWWVGFLAAWFLGIRYIPHQRRSKAYGQIWHGFLCVVGCALVCGACGFAYGLWRGPDADYSSWNFACGRYAIADTWSFVRVAYVHNASYFGGLLGLVVALVVIRPKRDPFFTPTE